MDNNGLQPPIDFLPDPLQDISNPKYASVADGLPLRAEMAMITSNGPDVIGKLVQTAFHRVDVDESDTEEIELSDEN
ncbi:unnamed protein product [Agarophyton chilense]